MDLAADGGIYILKKWICCILSVIAAMLTAVSVSADSLPYDSYIYDLQNEPLAIPAPYTVEKVLTGYDWGTDKLRDVSDMFYDEEQGRLYICDTGNHRVLVLDENFKWLHTIQTFPNASAEDALQSPTGLHVGNNELLITDSGNSRLLVFSCTDYSLLQEIGQPDIPLQTDEPQDFHYIPLKAVRDNAGRFYVIDENINQGLIRLDSHGDFISFVGAPSVQPTITQLLMRRFSTKEQRARMQKIVPTTYDSLLIDDQGFLYATSSTSSESPAVRLNTKGENILPEIEHFGDSGYTPEYGTKLTPYFVDIAVDRAGSIYLLDSDTGRIYTYSAEGELLYAFGGIAYQQGAFYSASSLIIMGDRLLVSDRSKGTVTVFHLTDFGKTINCALEATKSGDRELIHQYWSHAQSLCSNYLPAVIALERLNIENGNYNEALSRLKQIRAYDDYAVAFENVRNVMIRQNIPWILLALAGAVLVVVLAAKLLPRCKPVARALESDFYLKYKYGNHVMFHPLDGFWDIKREGRGDARAATAILLLFVLLYALRAQYSGYIVTQTISSDVSVWYECAMILLPLAFWIISNWCFTTLLDGKGTFLDIYTCTCYALKPYLWMSIPLLILSNILTAREAMFYQLLDQICVIWILALMFFGMMTIHDYSLSKAILTTALTIIGMMLIIFILLLTISIIQNIADFVISIYREISVRVYT